MTAAATPTRTAEAVVVTVGRLRRRIRDLSAAEDLTPSQRSVLARLAKEGPATASALAAGEHVRPQSMAATLAVLLELGHVERTDDPHDGRRRVVSLTASGAAWVRGNRAAKQEWLADTLAEQCSNDERAIVLAAMDILQRVAAS
jgi:DNA-binding MarR family transcriptional regulator